jgi:phosphoribosylanthranilate isomerase
MKIKVCGLSKIEEVKTSVANGANYCGFILNYPKSHRYISFELARTLTKIDKKVSKYVGVLVSPTQEELKKFSELDLDYFQLYGDYSNETLIKIKQIYKKSIISSLQVKKKSDVEKYKNIEIGSDIVLWDSSGYEESVSWNYNWIRPISLKVPKMVAGNITIDKLNDLVGIADIVDVSGALETNKVKDINKIKKFTAEIKKISYEN